MGAVRPITNTKIETKIKTKTKSYSVFSRPKSLENKNRRRGRSRKRGGSAEDAECTLTYRDIQTYSNTGDILLFKSKNASGNLVRAATNGGYDHIGMIFRLKGGKVGILEALGTGVQVFLWENFRKYKWFEQYPKIAMRSLIIPDQHLR
eukprot:230907_1